jgi:hypothetical protein
LALQRTGSSFSNTGFVAQPSKGRFHSNLPFTVCLRTPQI